MRIAEALLIKAGEGDEQATALLTDHTVYVVPRVNPDAAERSFAGVRQDRRRNFRPDDADRDARIDEDPPRPELNRGGGRDRFSTSRRNWSVALGNRSMSARQKPQNGSAPGALRIAVAGRRKRITPRWIRVDGRRSRRATIGGYRPIYT